MTETCEGRADNGWCRGLDVVRVEAMCVHEHLVTADLCGWHQQKTADGLCFCWYCEKVGHECVVRLLTPVLS